MLRLSYPRHGRTLRVCHWLVRVKVIPSNLRGHRQSKRITQQHCVRLLHGMTCGTPRGHSGSKLWISDVLVLLVSEQQNINL